MEFFETSKYFSLKKSTYINLRWIGIIGQLITVNSVYFILDFKFNFLFTNIIIILGIISNLYLIYIYQKTQLSAKSAFFFLLIDILQLSFLIYLTGGITNPFSIFLIIPSIFSSSNLDLKKHFHVSFYYYYSIPIALIVALIFLIYFAITFGNESRLRKEALNKIEEVMAKEHELVSLGGQAAAAAHSLGTPFSTIKIISRDLLEQFKNNKEVTKDIDLLVSQIERCSEILKRLTLNPVVEDDFIDKNFTIADYIKEIVKSFEEISNKKFIVNLDQNSNPVNLSKSIELVYGLRNFIGNANKFSKDKIFINIKSNNDFIEIIIEDDGYGYPKDVLNKIGEPYIQSVQYSEKPKTGLGLGIFIGKTLLEKNQAIVTCRNSKTRGGAEVSIKWKVKDLLNL